jgi:hypothetical protein
MCGFFSFCLYLLFKKQIIIIYSKKFHSGWAYLALLLLVVAVVNALMGMLSKENLLLVTERLLFWINRIHIQLLVGLILYFVSPLVLLL